MQVFYAGNYFFLLCLCLLLIKKLTIEAFLQALSYKK